MRGWDHTDDTEAVDYTIFQIRRYTAVSPRTGHAGRYVVLEAPAWANVVAITREGDAVLVRQYRHGIDAVTLEVPAGIVEQGEEPLAAVQRELAEETGYVSERWQDLGSVHPNPAFQNNRCYTFLALDCRHAAARHQDPGEDIEVVVLPLAEVGRLIREGAIDHALAIAAFFRYIQAGQPAGPLFT